MTDDHSSRSVSREAPSPSTSPPTIDYFSARDPQELRVRGLNFWAIVLVLSWAPYVCGIVNASTVVASYSQRIIASHTNGALLFMGVGLVLALGGLIGFIHQRHLWGSLAAGIVLVVQGTLAMCMGLAAR